MKKTTFFLLFIFSLSILNLIICDSKIKDESKKTSNEIKIDLSEIFDLVNSKSNSFSDKIKEVQGLLEIEEKKKNALLYAQSLNKALKKIGSEFVDELNFMKTVISSPSMDNPLFKGKFSSRPLNASSCFEVQIQLSTNFKTGSFFINKTRSTIDNVPAITKQVFCSENGETLIGIITFNPNIFKTNISEAEVNTIRKKSFESSVFFTSNKIKDINPVDLVQKKCKNLFECWSFFPKNSKKISFIVDYFIYFEEVKEMIEDLEKRKTFYIKSDNSVNVKDTLTNFAKFFKENKDNLDGTIKPAGIECNWIQKYSIQICSEKKEEKITFRSLSDSDKITVFAK